MSDVFLDDCKTTSSAEGFNSEKQTETATYSSLCLRGIQLAPNIISENNYTVAPPATAEKIRFLEQIHTDTQGSSDEPADQIGISSGGYSLEGCKLSEGTPEEEAPCTSDTQHSSDSVGALAEEALLCVTTEQPLVHAAQAARDHQASDARFQQPESPSDCRKLSKLLDNDGSVGSGFKLTVLENELRGGSTHSSTVPGGVTAYSSLLGGNLNSAARQRATESASWCSQHQAAALFCLKEQLLRDEAAAGRLRVRQQPNPHGGSFKPMRLYALKEIKELAVRVWGSLEAARTERERRIEERWLRKKRCNIHHLPPAKKKCKDASSLQDSPRETFETPTVVQPMHRARDAEWEEI